MTTKRAPKITHAPDHDDYTPSTPPDIEHPLVGPVRIWHGIRTDAHLDRIDQTPETRDYYVSMQLDHNITINGKTYRRITATATRAYSGEYTGAYPKDPYDTLTPAAQEVLRPILDAIAAEYIERHGGAEEIERQTRNASRTAQAEHHDKQAQEHREKARAYRLAIEPRTIERYDTEEAARQLDVWAINDADQYPARQEIEKSAEIYRLSGRLDNGNAQDKLREQARAWYANAARKWWKDVDEPGEPKTLFTVEALDICAREYTAHLIEEARLGNYEHHIDPDTRELLTRGSRFTR